MHGPDAAFFQAAEGRSVSRKRVERAHAPRRYRVCTTDSKHSLPVAANLLDRNFAAEKPDQILAGGYHLHPDRRGLVVPGRDPRPVHPKSGRLGNARAHARRTHDCRADHGNPVPPSGAGSHAPFGPWQYAAGDYRKILQAAAITQSMSRKANCWDNAPMESFFGTLKTELVHQGNYPDREAARRDLFGYIEGYYNRRGPTPLSATSLRSRQTGKPHNPVSTFPGEGRTSCERRRVTAAPSASSAP